MAVAAVSAMFNSPHTLGPGPHTHPPPLTNGWISEHFVLNLKYSPFFTIFQVLYNIHIQITIQQLYTIVLMN